MPLTCVHSCVAVWGLPRDAARKTARRAGASFAVAAAAVALFAAPARAITVFGYVANIEGIQETPAVATPAGGTGIFIIDTVANTMTFRIEWGGFATAETGAHIHGPAGPGVPAGILFALPAGNPKAGVWNYPAAMEADILAGRTYVNIHSAAFPGGEIRGQIVTHVASLSGTQETPPNASAGTGFGTFVMDPIANTLSYYISYGGLGSAESAAHIHGMAPHGVAAGILHPLPAANPKIGMWAYAEGQEGAILAGLTYVNIHTVGFGGGEIRGQIVNSLTTIQGLQETPPNASPAIGIGLFSHDLTGNRMGFHTRHSGLTAAETAAHIHGFAPRGVPAGILFALALGASKVGFWTHGAANEPGILRGDTYVNIHTGAFPGGEIRGQIEPRFSCWGDVNGDFALNNLDVDPFVNCVLGLGPCECADMNFDGVITGDDIQDFVCALLST